MINDSKHQANALTTAILMEAGITLMRQNLRRRHPDKTEEKIDALLGHWMQRADDPIPGDVSGPFRVRERNP